MVVLGIGILKKRNEEKRRKKSKKTPKDRR
jgi:hypothetical protein